MSIIQAAGASAARAMRVTIQGCGLTAAGLASACFFIVRSLSVSVSSVLNTKIHIDGLSVKEKIAKNFQCWYKRSIGLSLDAEQDAHSCM